MKYTEVLVLPKDVQEALDSIGCDYFTHKLMSRVDNFNVSYYKFEEPNKQDIHMVFARDGCLPYFTNFNIPGEVLYSKSNFILSARRSEFVNYEDMDDLTNKRSTFIASMKSLHEEIAPADIPIFGITSHIDALIDQIQQIEGYRENKSLKQLVKIYLSILRNVAIRLDDLSDDKSVCHNNLFMHNVYHDTYGKIAISDWSELGRNDYAWDYASLIARSSDCHNYVGILNANRLAYDVTNKYRDNTFPIRLIMCMSLIDFMDILKFIISKEQKGLGSYGDVFDSENHTEELLTERLMSFVTQSYTSIDYFMYVFDDKN